MNANFGRILLAVSAVFTMGLAACGGGYDCSATKCSADTKPTQAQIDSCEKAKSGACGSELEAYGSCIFDNLTCGSDDKVDPASGLTALSKCTSEATKAQECCAKNATADGCGG